MSQDRQEDLADAIVELLGGHHPADQVLHERLRHARVDRVVAHLVAHAVRAPAQRQLGQVARAQHDAAQVVGQAEQVVGAQARLDVLEGHVVGGLALAVGVADVGQHLRGRRADVDLLEETCPGYWHSRVAFFFVRSEVAKPGSV